MTERLGRLARLRASLGDERVRRARSTVAAQRRVGIGPLRVSWTLLSILAVLTVGVLVLAPSISLLIEQRQQIAEAQAQVDAQAQHVEDLQAEVARWDDPAYIVAQARGRLYYVFPGESTWIVIDDRNPSLDPPRAEDFSDEIHATQIDWSTAVVSSFLAAGLTDAPPPDADVAEPGPTPAPTDSPAPPETEDPAP